MISTLVLSCSRKHVPVDAVPELPYPTCEAAAPVRERVQDIRSGPDALEPNVTEHFELLRDPCLWTVRVRQEWPRGIADVEVVFDSNWLPLRAWKRMTIPGSARLDGHADTRRYELRSSAVTIKRKSPEGVFSFEMLRPSGKTTKADAHPVAVVGPGRALLTAWLRRAKLGVGGRVREPALDFREMVEVVRDVTLMREPDRFEPSLNKTVRVYTIYGREAFFADETDTVIGDLAGMRPDESLITPRPEPMPTYGAIDPVNTP